MVCSQLSVYIGCLKIGQIFASIHWEQEQYSARDTGMESKVQLRLLLRDKTRMIPNGKKEENLFCRKILAVIAAAFLPLIDSSP